MAWYLQVARDLPWRRRRDAYAIWVSEVMLQQTRVEVVSGRYEAFLERFPGVEDLAAAGEDEVLAAWSGLGYYRRARSLHRAAGIVAEEHGGRFPSDPETARSLPGVGPYTSGAVLSIAYGEPLPAIDGNAKRVLTRIFGIEGDPDRAPARGRIDRIARELVRGDDPGTWNQAVMELGALVCLPRSPHCSRCPLSGGDCVAQARGIQAELPTSGPRPESTDHEIAAAVVRGEGRIFLRRGSADELVRGMWEVPWIERGDDAVLVALEEHLQTRHGLEIEGTEPVGRIRHTIARRRYRVEVFTAEGSMARGEGGCWMRPEQITAQPMSSLLRKVLRAARCGELAGLG